MIIASYTPGYTLAMGYFAPREIKKNTCSSSCVFITFCIKIAWITNGGQYIFMYIFKAYLLSLSHFYIQFAIKIFIVTVTAKCWSEGCSEGCFPPPPLFFLI